MDIKAKTVNIITVAKKKKKLEEIRHLFELSTKVRSSLRSVMVSSPNWFHDFFFKCHYDYEMQFEEMTVYICVYSKKIVNGKPAELLGGVS